MRWDERPSRLDDSIARVFLTVHHNTIVLLHGFIKKTQKIPSKELELAGKRLARLRGE